jgi:hypothetical protein
MTIVDLGDFKFDENGMTRVRWYGSPADVERARKNMAIRDQDYSSGVQGMGNSRSTVMVDPTNWVHAIPIPWKLYGVTRDDEKTWLGDFVSEGEITGFANFFANNPHFEHMEIHEGNNFKYAVMRIVGGRRD